MKREREENRAGCGCCGDEPQADAAPVPTGSALFGNQRDIVTNSRAGDAGECGAARGAAGDVRVVAFRLFGIEGVLVVRGENLGRWARIGVHGARGARGFRGATSTVCQDPANRAIERHVVFLRRHCGSILI